LGIEGVNMRKKHYNLLRKVVIGVPCLGAIFFAAVWTAMSQVGDAARLADATNVAFQQQDTLRTSSLESHEGVTISAKPWTQASQYKEKFPKKSPFSGGVMAVQIAIRNDSPESIKVGLDRIRLSFQLDEDNRQELQPMKAEEVADAVLRPASKDPTKTRRLPLPITTGTNKSKDFLALQTAVQNAAVPTSVVAPQSTVEGLLYFELDGQYDLLRTAHLYVPDIAVLGKDRSLTYFEIDLSR
jgi:hypothetical protein